MTSLFCCLLHLVLFFLPVRYNIILKDKVPAAADDKKRSTDLLIKYDKTKKEWQLGKTKVRFSSIFGNISFRLWKAITNNNCTSLSFI